MRHDAENLAAEWKLHQAVRLTVAVPHVLLIGCYCVYALVD